MGKEKGQPLTERKEVRQMIDLIIFGIGVVFFVLVCVRTWRGRRIDLIRKERR